MWDIITVTSFFWHCERKKALINARAAIAETVNATIKKS